MRTIISAAGVVAVGGLLAACGSSATDPGAHHPHAQAPPLKPLALRVESPGTVYSPHVILRGIATPGATVLVAATAKSQPLKAMAGADGAWRAPAVGLILGHNFLQVTATEAGYQGAQMTRDVTYQLTAAQIAARKAARQRQLAAQRQRLAEQRAAAAQRQAAQRQAAIERAAVAKQNFINQSAAIPYAELIKSTAPYVGKKIALHGQIFQIQQGGQGGVMLLSVDNTYGIWTDHVWVDYDTNNPYVQGNIVTVYGTVTGTKSYVSQAGYNIYVPEVHARYTESG